MNYASTRVRDATCHCWEDIGLHWNDCCNRCEEGLQRFEADSSTSFRSPFVVSTPGCMLHAALLPHKDITMQAARTSQRSLRASSTARLFSSCPAHCKAASSPSKAAGTSENSQRTGSSSSTFTPRPRFYDSLSKKSAPKARHYDMKDNPLIRLTVRPPSSPAPVSHPAIASTSTTTANTSSETQLPPQLHKETPERATLSAEQIAEMQALRLSDPVRWTRSKLAEKYNVSKFFVAMKSFGDSHEAKIAARTVKETHDQAEQLQRDRWGFKKRVDREVRRRRKEFW